MQEKLENIIEFTAGKNITRLNEIPESNVYTQKDFDDDLNGVNQDYISGCIINLMKSKIAPCTKFTSEKCLITNFLSCTFDKDTLDQWYLCYLFNESKAVERQMNRFQQASVLSVRKLTIKSIGDLKINLIDIDKQRNIGKLYKEYLRKNYLMRQQIENISKLTKETIRRIEED